MDFSFRNSFKHMRNLWAGEEAIRKNPFCREQDCDSDKESLEGERLMNVSIGPKPLPTELAQGDSVHSAACLQQTQHPIHCERAPRVASTEARSLQTSREYQLEGQKMAPIVGTYQHERNENLDGYLKAMEVPYIIRKLVCVSRPRLEITNNGEKWTVGTITMLNTFEQTFSLGEEYEQGMLSGGPLKCVTTVDGDSLITTSITPDKSKVLQKYEFTDDNVVLD